MAFTDYVKKAIKYTVPGAYLADKAKDKFEATNTAPRRGAPSVGASGLTGDQGDGTIGPVNPTFTIPTQPNGGTSVLGASTTADSYMGGAYTGDGSNPAVNKYKTSVTSNWQRLNQIYDSLFGDVDNQVTEKANEIGKQYDTQLDDLNKGYQTTLGQTGMAYAARGLGDSSYLGDAQGQNAQAYDRSVGDLTQQKSGALGSLGQYATTTKSNFGAQRDAFAPMVQNFDQYDEQGQANLDSQLSGAVTNAQGARSNFLTNPQQLEQLNKISPIQQQGTGQLATRLQTLLTSSAPAFAKKQIAQGLIKATTLNDENAKGYWSAYFEDLLRKQGA